MSDNSFRFYANSQDPLNTHIHKKHPPQAIKPARDDLLS